MLVQERFAAQHDDCRWDSGFADAGLVLLDEVGEDQIGVLFGQVDAVFVFVDQGHLHGRELGAVAFCF